MNTENSQFDLSGIQLRESKTQPKVSFSREIGEAQIVHTIFGKAKVRIIRKNDNLYRMMRIAAMVIVAAIGAVALQNWYAAQHPEAEQGADLTGTGNGTDPAGTKNAQEQAVAPDSKSTDGETPIVSPSVKNVAVIPPLTTTSKPAVSRESEPRQASGLKEAGQKDEKPVTAQEKPVAVNPKPVKPLTNTHSPIAPATATVTGSALKNQTDKPKPAVVPPTKQPVEASSTPAASQGAASSPTAAVPLASPLDSEDKTPKPSADENQLSDPINVQSN